jgi:hypothetical protein
MTTHLGAQKRKMHEFTPSGFGDIEILFLSVIYPLPES